MKKNLLILLCSPCCRAELKIDDKEILINDAIENKYEDIIEGILCCLSCNKEYPIINGIPRLSTELWKEEVRELQRLKNKTGLIIKRGNIKKSYVDYEEIEKKIRKKIKIPSNASKYLKERIENDIYFRVRGCEKQEKYVQSLKLYYDNDIETILEIGGGQGGLIKFFSEHYSPDLSIMLDIDLDWVEIAKFRNPDVQIIRGNAINIPIKIKSIDLVISKMMLEHIKEYDTALKEMCEVAKNVFFVCWGPNKFSLYDFGHLDAPVTIFPKIVAKYIAILWHKIRRTGRNKLSIMYELDNTYYISTTHVKNILKKYGHVYNVFTDFSSFSIKSNYSYRMKKIKQYLLKHIFVAKLIFKLLVLFKIEPQCYYILRKDT